MLPFFFKGVSLKGKVVKKIKHVSYAFKIEDFNISFAYFCFPFEPFLYPLYPLYPLFYGEGIPNLGKQKYAFCGPYL